ncbi:Fe-S-containing hydro-lyase [Neisseria sp. Ec49-e6-T10]|uniref:Fe-S-containing hydro-lyase n=1 Tax=Neisseria sp. Ec49-e6-T10 TaxID=3140744 RepID=UPI003EB82F58
MSEQYIQTPLTNEVIDSLQVGQMVYISGTVYTARDAAHKRLVEMIQKNEPLPFDFTGQIVYYAGPCPNKPGFVIGSVGPTTSGRMDAYAPLLIEHGLKGMIGKGLRDDGVKEAIVKYKGVYFAAIGGAAALMSQCITHVDIIAFEDLGTEAIRKLTVKNLPVIVAIDAKGNDVYLK